MTKRKNKPSADSTLAQMQARVEKLRVESRFWGELLAHPILTRFLDDIQKECEQTALVEWLDIEPKRFAQSQALVLAKRHFLREFRNLRDRAESELTSLRKQIVEYEEANPLLAEIERKENEADPANVIDAAQPSFAERIAAAQSIDDAMFVVAEMTNDIDTMFSPDVIAALHNANDLGDPCFLHLAPDALDEIAGALTDAEARLLREKLLEMDEASLAFEELKVRLADEQMETGEPEPEPDATRGPSYAQRVRDAENAADAASIVRSAEQEIHDAMNNYGVAPICGPVAESAGEYYRSLADTSAGERAEAIEAVHLEAGDDAAADFAELLFDAEQALAELSVIEAAEHAMSVVPE